MPQTAVRQASAGFLAPVVAAGLRLLRRKLAAAAAGVEAAADMGATELTDLLVEDLQLQATQPERAMLSSVTVCYS